MNPSVLDTLRELGALQRSIAEEFAEYPMKAIFHERFAEATIAGYHAYEVLMSHRDIVVTISELEQHKHGFAVDANDCQLCVALTYAYRELGKSFYQQTRQLLKVDEEAHHG